MNVKCFQAIRCVPYDFFNLNYFIKENFYLVIINYSNIDFDYPFKEITY